MSISVIIPTLGEKHRRERLVAVIDTTLKQQPPVLEVIIVWQGENDQEFFSKLPPYTRVIIQPIPAVSLARNLGASKAIGEWLCFLDDDTIPILDRTLAFALDQAKRNQLDFILANIRSEGQVLAAQPIEDDIAITRKTLRGNFCEAGLIINRTTFIKTGYNDCLGPGCIHGSSEGFDLGARLLAQGYRGIRLKKYELDHPPLPIVTTSTLDRVIFYSLGNGYTLMKHGFYGLYLYELGKCMFFLLAGLLRFDSYKIRHWSIRFLCLMLGPLIPPSPPRILPPRFMEARNAEDYRMASNNAEDSIV